MENINETAVTPEEEVAQPVAQEQPAEKKNFADSAKDFSQKLDLEGKSKALMAGGTKAWGKIKALPKKVWMAIGAGAAALVVAIVLIAILTNTYKTPINILQKQYNAKVFYKNEMQELKEQLNGFASSEMSTLIKLMKKTEDYKEELNDAKEAFKEDVEEMKEEYGSNFKYKFKVTEKEKLDKDDLKDYRSSIRDSAKSLANRLDDFIDDADSDDWADLAEDLGLSKSQTKELVKTALKIAKKLKSVKITAGYELSVTRTLSGKEMDEPEERELTYTVYKVNGRWMTSSALNSLYMIAASLSSSAN